MLFIALLSLFSFASNAQAYSYQVTKIQRTAADSIKRDSIINVLVVMADKTEKDNPWAGVVLRSLACAMLMERENELSKECEFITSGMLLHVFKEIEETEKSIEIARRLRDLKSKKN